MARSAPPAAVAPPLRADAARNRLALMRAAHDVFAEQGLDAPIAEIARRAGCAKGTFFRHFATKDDVIAALFADRLGQLAAVAERARTEHEPGWAALCAMIEGFDAIIAADRSVLQAAAHRSGVDHEQAHAALRLLDREVETVLRAAQAAGEVRPDVVPTDIQLIAMAVTSATAPLHDAHPLLGRRHLRIMLDGLRAGETTDLGAPPVTREELDAAKAARRGPPCGP